MEISDDLVDRYALGLLSLRESIALTRRLLVDENLRQRVLAIVEGIENESERQFLRQMHADVRTWVECCLQVLRDDTDSAGTSAEGADDA